MKGLIGKGLIEYIGNTDLQITGAGKTELTRVSEIIDDVWDRLTVNLKQRERAALKDITMGDYMRQKNSV